MTGIDRIHLANEAFATSVIVAMGAVIGYTVNIFFPITRYEDEESAYQQDANSDLFPVEPDVAGVFPVKGLNIRRFIADESLDLYPQDQEMILYLPKELDIPNGVKIIIVRGQRFLAYSGDVIDVFEGVENPIFKSIRLEPMEV